MSWLDFFASIRDQASDKELFDEYVKYYADYTERIVAETEEELRWYYIDKRKECEWMLMRLTKTGLFSGTKI